MGGGGKRGPGMYLEHLVPVIIKWEMRNGTGSRSGGGGSEVKVTCSLRNIQQGYMLNTRPKLCESGVTHTALIAQVVGLQGDVSVGKVFALQG